MCRAAKLVASRAAIQTHTINSITLLALLGMGCVRSLGGSGNGTHFVALPLVALCRLPAFASSAFLRRRFTLLPRMAGGLLAHAQVYCSLVEDYLTAVKQAKLLTAAVRLGVTRKAVDTTIGSVRSATPPKWTPKATST